ncbi:MAG: HupE/UreJ family protein [Phycisphaerales bacterium]|nr:HupE/UreJ family protein [Phycisphaerales bacterium]MCB9862400.1 HupE/UreJ family protein [Phycisphaerales bacterium]
MTRRLQRQTTCSIPWVFMGLLLFGATRPAVAHNLSVTQTLVIFKTDGTYLIDIRMHLDALALGMSADTPAEAAVDALRGLSPEDLQKRVDDLASMLSHRTRIRFDDIKQRPQPTFPEYHTTLAASSPEPTVLGTTARSEGRVPENAKTFRIGLSRAFGMTQVTIVEEGTGVVQKHLLSAGEDTPTFSFGGSPTAANAADWRETFGRYIIAGFEHIIPLGIDHILFVLGLFLLSTKLSSLLWQISAFTIAHSISLALAMGGVVSLPAGIVEPLIALSIAYVAIENIATKNMKPWRPFVVFAFGLLHGMGFAGVLMELGFPQGQFATALVGFNLGVEFGQLSVVAIAFLAVGWFQKKDWYRAAVVVPQSLLIAAVGLYWTVERIAAAA